MIKYMYNLSRILFNITQAFFNIIRTVEIIFSLVD